MLKSGLEFIGYKPEEYTNNENSLLMRFPSCLFNKKKSLGSIEIDESHRYFPEKCDFPKKWLPIKTLDTLVWFWEVCDDCEELLNQMYNEFMAF